MVNNSKELKISHRSEKAFKQRIEPRTLTCNCQCCFSRALPTRAKGSGFESQPGGIFAQKGKLQLI